MPLLMLRMHIVNSMNQRQGYTLYCTALQLGALEIRPDDSSWSSVMLLYWTFLLVGLAMVLPGPWLSSLVRFLDMVVVVGAKI